MIYAAVFLTAAFTAGIAYWIAATYRTTPRTRGKQMWLERDEHADHRPRLWED